MKTNNDILKNIHSLTCLFITTLLVMVGALSASAEETVATWALNAGGADQTAVFSAGTDMFKVGRISTTKTFEVGSTLTYNEVTYTKVKESEKITSNNKTHYVDFIVVPKKGVTFVPKSVSFNAIRLGTGGGYFSYSIVSGDTEEELATGIHPSRNNADAGDGYDFSSNITGTISCTRSNPCILRIYIYNLDANKELGFANVKIEGEYSGTPEDETVNDFSAILNNKAGTLIEAAEQVQGTSVSFGVAHDGTRVAVDDASAVGTISGKYHGEHGMTNLAVTANVLGAVKISVGECQFSSNTITVKDANGDVVATKVPETVCWKNNTANVAVLYYEGPATTLTISGMGYCPFISVEAIDEWNIPKTVNVSYSTSDAQGTAPATVEVKMFDSYTLPQNHTLYKEGYTLTGWNDGTDTYPIGGTYMTGEVDVHFTPVFTENTKTLFGNTSSVTVKVDFQRKNGAPMLNVGGNTSGFYVTQTTIDGETIDVKVDYNTKTGKIANANWTDWCQLNGGFEFYLPSCRGAVVSMETYSASVETTIDGVALTGNTSKTPSCTVASDNNPITVVYGGDASYFRWIQVVLPAAPSIITDVNANGYSVRQGRSAVISVEADNATSYQWYSNTTASNEGGTIISGANNSTYSFSTTGETAIGTYYVYCVATNSMGSATSSVATIEVTQGVNTAHTFDFTNWIAETKAALAADTEAWDIWEKANGTGNQGGNYNINKLENKIIEAGGSYIEETYPLLFSAPSRGLGFITDLGSTNLGTYAGSQYLWFLGVNTYLIVPNVKTGTTMKLGVESHKLSDSRGFNVSYAPTGTAPTATDTWSTPEAYKATTFEEMSVDIPAVDGQNYVDVKIQATAGAHLYYIDCVRNDFQLLKDEVNMVTGVTYTVQNGVDYTTASGAAVTYSIANTDVAEVNAEGVITPKALGSTTLTITLAAHNGLPAISGTMTIGVTNASDLSVIVLADNKNREVGEGSTYKITKNVDYTTSSDGALTFTSTDESIATVDAEGNVFAWSAGDFSIIVSQAATSSYGSGTIRLNFTAKAASDFPEITKNLSDSLVVYTYATNSLVVKANNATSYQWYTCDDVSMTNSLAIEGETSNVMKFRPTSTESKYYYCLISNSQGRIVSEVCKVKPILRRSWLFTMDEAATNEVLSSISTYGVGTYFNVVTENQRYSVAKALNQSDVLLTENASLPMTAGLMFTTTAGQIIVGDYRHSTYSERLQINGAQTLIVPACEEGDVISIVATWASKNKGSIKVAGNATANSGAEEDALTGSYDTFKYTVTADGDVTFTINGACLQSLNVSAAHPVTQQYYDIKAIAGNDENNVLKTLVSNAVDWTEAIVKTPYPYWLTDVDGKLYKYGQRGNTFVQNFNLVSDTTFFIKYNSTAIDHVVFLSEAEKISGSTLCTSTNTAARSSMCEAAYNATENGITLATLPAGIYKIRAVIFDPKYSSGNSSVHSFSIGNQIVELTSSEINFNEVESDAIEIVKDGTPVVWLPTANIETGLDAILIYDTQTPRAETPTITLDDDNYTFTLSTSEENAEIYYTLNGDTPSKNVGTLYDGEPVRLSSNCTIQAITVAPEKRISQVADLTTKYTTYKLNVQAWPNTYGAVTLTPEATGNKYLPGTQVTLRAAAKTGFGFIGWSATKTGEVLSTDYSYTITMPTEDMTLYGQFKKGETGTVYYDVKNAVILAPEGTDVNDLYVVYDDFEANELDANDPESDDISDYIPGASIFPASLVSTAINVPNNYTLGNDNYTLLYWIDENNKKYVQDAHVDPESDADKYMPGENRLFTQEGQSVHLRPVFRMNIGSEWNVRDILDKRTEKCSIKWDFRTGFGAQSLELDEGKNIGYFTHAVVNSEKYTDYVVDIPLTIVTGEGVVNNTDIDTWCYISKGVKMTIPSSYEAKVTLATYAPIREDNGTTVNGQVPDNLYDEDLKKDASGAYLYTWTVNDNDLTTDIVIGDDYAYYQYVEVELYSATTKELFLSTNNAGMGTVSASPEPIETTDENGMVYTNGTTVTLTTKRSHYYELKYWLDGDGNKIYPDGRLEDAEGNVYGPFTGSFVLGDKISGASSVNISNITESSITVEMSDFITLQAVFGEKTSYYIDFSAGGYEGLPLYQQHVEYDEKFVMPSHNQNIYREGYTLDYYYDSEDESQHYSFGESYFATKNMLLIPHFKANTKSLGDVTKETTVTWPLAVGEGATEIYYNKSAGLIVDQLRFDDDCIDLPLYINGNSGSAINTVDDAYCSVASGCIMQIPTVTGCQISLNASNGNFVNTTIAGSSSQNSGSATKYTVGKTVTVTYNGTNAQEPIRFREARQCTWVKATYYPITSKPDLDTVYVSGVGLGAQLATLRATGSITGYAAKPDYTKNILGEVTATAKNGGVVNIVQATPENHTATLLVSTAGGVTVATYTIEFSVTDEENPVLQSVTVAGKSATADGSTTVAEVGTNGVVKLTFNHAMSNVTLTEENHGLSTSEEGNVVKGVAETTISGNKNVYTLNLTYWGLKDGTHTLTIPAGTLTDAYGVAYNSPITVKFTTVSRNIGEKRLFDFVVTHKQSWNAETQTAGDLIQTVSDEVIANLDSLNILHGTIDEGIAASHASAGTTRYYIFVPDGEYQFKGNQARNGVYNDTKNGNNQGLNVKNYYNGETWINRDNLSLIGQSKDGTILFNDPFIYGISYTSSIEVRAMKKDNYFQDFTVDNRYSKYQVERGDANPGGQAVAVYDRGIHSIWKNVAMYGYQDTYSSGSNTSGSATTPGYFHTYRYYEDCLVAGTVDFICGGGDDWWERPTFVIRKRSTANNIVAARQVNTNISCNYLGDDYMFKEKWGYVFNNGKIKAENGDAYSKQNGRYTIARTWQNSPANTFLYTTYEITPEAGGYSNMSQNLLCRMHEYGSMNADGTAADLTKRTIRASTPAAGSDDCILTAEQAAEYTLHNVLGGDDAYDPTIYTKQVSMAEASVYNATGVDGKTIIKWTESDNALCYFIFRLDEVTGDTVFHSMTTAGEFYPGENQGGRWFVVRAANERGGLGAPSKAVQYKPLESYEVVVTQVGPNPEMGWATVCLPQNATFTDIEGLNVYAAVQFEGTTLKLKKVKGQDGLFRGRGYVIYARPGKYIFRGTYGSITMQNENSTLGELTKYSVLDGNPEDHAVSIGTKNIYTLAYLEDINPDDVGFYKYRESMIPARKAYLQYDLLEAAGISLDTSAKGGFLSFLIDDEEWDEAEADGIDGVTEDTENAENAIYELSGRRIERSQMRKGMIYIIGGKKVMY